MGKVRTIQAAYDELKSIDPDTSISKYHLSQLIKSGAIPSMRAGVKWLVDMDNVNSYFDKMLKGAAKR